MRRPRQPGKGMWFEVAPEGCLNVFGISRFSGSHRSLRSCKKMRPQAGVGKLKHDPPLQANDLLVVAQAVSPANRIILQLLTVAARLRLRRVSCYSGTLPNKLEIPGAEIREMGRAALDLVAEYYDTLAARAVLRPTASA